MIDYIIHINTDNKVPNKLMTSIAYADIEKLCTTFVNDTDTTIGMECDWHDFLIWQVKHDFNKADIMSALNINTSEYAVPIEVLHNKYGKMNVYIALYDNSFEISTKEWLLNDENEYRHVVNFDKSS